MSGVLYVVATPIGNLDDVSPRALEVLRSVARIACEDTRRTARLLARYGVRTPMVSCHSFNESKRIEPLVELLREGRDVALVSDAGTPCVSDPGTRLVRAALDAGVRVVPVPGPSAAVALLSASGLPADRFVFEGYLPPRAAGRRRRLEELRAETRTMVLFEAPHRIRRALEDMAGILGERQVVVGRELTKLHEAILRGTPRQVLAALAAGGERGEFTLVVAGASEPAREGAGPAGRGQIRRAWRQALLETGGDPRSALRRAALFRLLSELGETDAR